MPCRQAMLNVERISVAMRISCEVRVLGGEHTLKFVFKGEERGKWLGSGRKKDFRKQLGPTEYVFFGCEQRGLSLAHTGSRSFACSIEIRNFALTEKIS